MHYLVCKQIHPHYNLPHYRNWKPLLKFFFFFLTDIYYTLSKISASVKVTDINKTICYHPTVVTHLGEGRQ